MPSEPTIIDSKRSHEPQSDLPDSSRDGGKTLVDKQLEKINNQQEEPKLVVSVKIGKNRTEPIVIYEADKADDLARDFCREHQLDDAMYKKLVPLLEEQIATVLSRIPESEDNEELDSLRNTYK